MGGNEYTTIYYSLRHPLLYLQGGKSCI